MKIRYFSEMRVVGHDSGVEFFRNMVLESIIKIKPGCWEALDDRQFFFGSRVIRANPLVIQQIFQKANQCGKAFQVGKNGFDGVDGIGGYKTSGCCLAAFSKNSVYLSALSWSSKISRKILVSIRYIVFSPHPGNVVLQIDGGAVHVF